MAEKRFDMAGKALDPAGYVPAPTLHAVLRAVRDAEVLYVNFVRLQHGLVIDPRTGKSGYPAALVASVQSGDGGAAGMAERMRPGQPPTDGRSIATTWGGSTRAFEEQGVLAAIVARLPPEAEASVLDAFAQLQAAEAAPPPSRVRPRTPFNEPLD